MAHYIWIIFSFILVFFAGYLLIKFLASFKNNKYMRFWYALLIILLVSLSYFCFYLYKSLGEEVISKEIYLALILSLSLALVSIIIIYITIRVFESIKQSQERLINLNFVLDNETQFKADNFENEAHELSKKNELLAVQAEVLSEKEAELKKINARLVETQTQLEKEKNSVEQKVVERTKQLKHEKENVEALLNQKTEFINQLSHDLRTPITPLLNLLPFLGERTKDKESSKLIEICIKNTKYLEKLVLSTLSLARLGAKNLNLELTKTNIHELLSEIIDVNQSNFKTSNLNIINDINKDVRINIDRLKMREVLENIINNAIRYNESKSKKLIITSQTKNGYLELNFTDNGIGMEPKYLNMVFTEFFKIDPSRHQHDSSGLGLSIAKRIVELHKGKIMAFSEGLNKGSTITLQLPLDLKV